MTQTSVLKSILNGNIGFDETSFDNVERKKKSIKKLKDENKQLDNRIKQLLEKGSKILGKEVTDLYQMYELLNKELERADGEKRKEITDLLNEVKEELAKQEKDVILSYERRAYIDDKADKFAEKVAKVSDFNIALLDYLGIKWEEKVRYEQVPMSTGAVREIRETKTTAPTLFKEYEPATIESFIRNFDKISDILKNVDSKTLKQKRKELEQKLRQAGYYPDGGEFDKIGFSELPAVKAAVDFVNSNEELKKKVRILSWLFTFGVTPQQIERSKIALDKTTPDNLFDWLGDYDGNGELTKDDKGIYHGEQLAEMFKRMEKMDSKNFYKNITNILQTASKLFGFDWQVPTIDNRQDLYNFMKQHPEAKYVLVKQYERLPVENLALDSKEMAKYLEAEEKVFEKNPFLAEIEKVVSDKLFEKLSMSEKDIIKQLEKAKEKATGEDKKKIDTLITKLQSSSGKEDLVKKLKPSIIGVVLSLVKGSEGIGVGAGWSKDISEITNSIIDNLNFSLGFFKGKGEASFVPGMILSVGKEIVFGKDEDKSVDISAGTVLGVVHFIGLGMRKKYDLPEMSDIFDPNSKVKYFGAGIYVSTIGWGLHIEKGDDRLEAVKRNTENFAKFMNKLLEKDLRKKNIDIDSVAEKYDVAKQDVQRLVNNIKSVIDLYPSDVEWEILKQSILTQYVAQYYDSQMAYLSSYHNNEISGWKAGISFILGFLPMPFISPVVSHYNREYVQNVVDKLRDYSYLSFADKDLKTENDLVKIAQKIEATFGNQVKVEKTPDNKLVLTAPEGKDILDIVNVYYDPKVAKQIKYTGKQLVIGNVGSIYASFVAEGKGLKNYLFLGTDKVEGAIKLSKSEKLLFAKNNPESIIYHFDKKWLINQLSKSLGIEKAEQIVDKYFIEEGDKLYLVANKGELVDITNGGYSIIIGPNGVEYNKFKNNKLEIKVYDVEKKEAEFHLPERIEELKRDFASLFEEKWVDLAKLRNNPEFKEFEEAKINRDYDIALREGIVLINSLFYATELINELKVIKDNGTPQEKYYAVDIIDRYLRTDIEFSSKLHRQQLLNQLEISEYYNLLTDSEKQVISLLKDNKIKEAEELAKKLGYKPTEDNAIATMFNYLDGRLPKDIKGDSYRSIFKQLYFAYSDHFGGEIFGKQHDRERVFKEIFEKYGLSAEIVDKVLGTLKKQIDSNQIQSEPLPNVIAFMSVAGIRETGDGKIESTGKGLHGQAPGVVEAIKGTVIDITNPQDQQKVVELIMEDSFYKDAIRRFVIDMLKQVGYSGEFTDDQLEDLLTNGQIKLNINGKEVDVKLDRKFIAFAYDVCGNVSVGMQIDGLSIVGPGATILAEARDIKFGIGAEGVTNIDSGSVTKLVASVVVGGGEKSDEKSSKEAEENNNNDSNSNSNSNSTTTSDMGQVNSGDQGSGGSVVP